MPPAQQKQLSIVQSALRYYYFISLSRDPLMGTCILSSIDLYCIRLYSIFNICIKSNPLASLERHVQCTDHSSFSDAAQLSPSVKVYLLSFFSKLFYHFQLSNDELYNRQTATVYMSKDLLYIVVGILYNTHKEVYALLRVLFTIPNGIVEGKR